MKLYNTYLNIIKEETLSGDASGYSSKYAFIKKLKDDNVLTEMPHTHYDETDIPDLSNVYVDFKFEKMKISNEEKDEIIKTTAGKLKMDIEKYKKIYKNQIESSDFTYEAEEDKIIELITKSSKFVALPKENKKVTSK